MRSHRQTESLASNPEMQRTVSQMVGQCFETLATYGKTTEELGSMVKMFQATLAEYEPDDIKAAFIGHLKNNSVMPAPADIIGRIKEIVKFRREREELKSKPLAIEAPRRESRTRVSWALKHWNDFTEQDKAGLAKHLTTLSKDEGEEYRKYLVAYCGVPRRVLV